MEVSQLYWVSECMYTVEKEIEEERRQEEAKRTINDDRPTTRSCVPEIQSTLSFLIPVHPTN